MLMTENNYGNKIYDDEMMITIMMMTMMMVTTRISKNMNKKQNR